MAKAKEVKVKFGADTSGYAREMRKLSKQSTAFKSELVSMGKSLMGIFAVGSIASFVVESGKAAEEAERANKRLQLATNGNSVAYAELTRQAEELQNKIGIDDEAIKDIQVLGLETGKTAEMVKKMVKATTELSALTGEDLNSSFKTINATFSGVVKSLKRLDPDFGNLTKTQLANGEAVDLIIKKYDGLAEKSAKASDKLKVSWEELKESVGARGGLLEIINWMVEGVQGLNTNFQLLNSNKLTFFEKFTHGQDYLLDRLHEVNEAMDAQIPKAFKYFQAFAAKIPKKPTGEGGGGTGSGKKTKKEKDPFLLMPDDEGKGTLDDFAKFWVQTTKIEDDARQEIADSEQQWLDDSGAAWSEYFQNRFDNQAANLLKMADADKRFVDDMNAMINSGMANMIASLTDSLTQVFTGDISMEGLFYTTLGTIGQFLKEMGTALIAYGVLLEAFTVAWDPATKIVAGIAAVAAGAVLTSLANKGLQAHGMAEGGIVPSGFPNDSYPALLSSGEVVLPKPKKLPAVTAIPVDVEVHGVLKAGDIAISNKRGEYLRRRIGSDH